MEKKPQFDNWPRELYQKNYTDSKGVSFLFSMYQSLNVSKDKFDRLRRAWRYFLQDQQIEDMYSRGKKNLPDNLKHKELYFYLVSHSNHVGKEFLFELFYEVNIDEIVNNLINTFDKDKALLIKNRADIISSIVYG